MIISPKYTKDPARQAIALTAQDALSHAEVSDLVDDGQLYWRTTAPALDDGHVYTAGDILEHIRTLPISAPRPLDELIPLGQIMAWADTTPPTPRSFSGVQDIGALPTRVVILSWDNAGASKAKVLQHYDEMLGLWVQIAAPLAVDSSFIHGSNAPHDGINEYRIRWSDNPADWAYTEVAVIV